MATTLTVFEGWEGWDLETSEKDDPFRARVLRLVARAPETLPLPFHSG